ncbi:MAG: HAD-IC family P-type ATPase, partial [Lachnospiraceae bacterium]|nr:HAD-IC family P-type ATPase [Lachnospiraceae bacterium]
MRQKKLQLKRDLPEEERVYLPEIDVDPNDGLTQEQVEERVEAGFVNTPVDPDTRTIKEIIRKNTLTYFNMIFVILAILLAIVQSYRDMLFMGVIFCNTMIGIIQEIRSKRVLDRMKILNTAQVTAIRDGQAVPVRTDELVLDDVIELTAGAQIPADAVVLSGSIQVNESLLTGESDEISKHPGKRLLSGSFVVSGKCLARLTAVGEDSYISKLTLQATKQKGGEQSEMIRALDRLVKIVGVIIIPIGALLFYQQFIVLHSGFRDSVTNMVAAVIGMIPEGLYLTASVALAVSAMRLAQKKVLIHDMKSMETLARVTVLCVDKTGTITEDHMEVKNFLTGLAPEQDEEAEEALPQPAETVPTEQPESVSEEGSLEQPETAQVESFLAQPETAADEDFEDIVLEQRESGAREVSVRALSVPKEKTISPAEMTSLAVTQEEAPSPEEIRTILCDFVQGMPADNATMRAMKDYFTEDDGRRPTRVVPFSSRVKYSGAVINGVNYVLGAPEFLLGDDYERYQDMIETHGEAGYRVMAFGIYDGELDGELLTHPIRLLGTVLLANRVRAGAADTFRYFAERDVAVKVISGDNPVSVSAIAQEAGIEGAEDYVDAQTLTDERSIYAAMKRYTVFGRVTPDQKRTFVKVLQDMGETVAMTGDGVNDVLALKDADCSIAMASGSEAASQVAQLVLLDSDFAKMPDVVLEGRRVVNNIERTASLFLVKNIFSLLLSVFSVILVMDYPLEAAQLSLISMFTIGIPAFLLSQEPNKDPIRGRFLTNVLLRALPAGLTDFGVVLALVLFCEEFQVGSDSLSTACTLLVSLVGFMIMYRIMKPMTRLHWVILISMIVGLVFSLFRLDWFYSIQMVTKQVAMLMIVFGIIAEPCMRYLGQFTEWLLHRIWKKWYVH